jgi:hypothetical protein
MKDDQAASPVEMHPASDGWCRAVAAVRDIGGRPLLILPFAAPIGSSRGRRFLVGIGDGPPRRQVVLSVGGHAALVPPVNLPAAATTIDVQLRPLPARRRPRIPADLRELLAACGLVVEEVPEAELTQLVHMVNESATPGVRAARLEAAREVVSAWSRRDSRG